MIDSIITFDRRVCKLEYGPIFEHDYMGRRLRGHKIVESLVDELAETGVETLMTNLMPDDDHSLCQSSILSSGSQEDARLLEKFIKLCHKKGIEVMGEFALLLWPSLHKKYPDWLIEDLDDGREQKENASAKGKSFFCIHSPFREWISTLLEEYAVQFNVDGFWFDDTNFGTRTQWPWPYGCRCRYCKEKFKTDLGADLPEKVDWKSDLFKKFIIWRKERLNEFLQYVTSRVQLKRPGLPLIFNHYTLNYVNGETAHAFEPIKRSYYYFTEDYITHYLAAKIMRAEKNDYFEVWNWATELIPGVAHGMPPYPSPYNSIIIGMSVMANGGTPVLAGITHDMRLYKDYFSDVYGEYKKRKEYMGGRSYKNCAVHFSLQTRDFRYGDKPRDYRTNLQGIYEALDRSQVITDIIVDQQINSAELKDYKFLYLPDSACLSDEQCESIRNYVKNGGIIAATLDTSLYDETGAERRNFGLADVFGADYCGNDGEVFKPDREDGRWFKILGNHHGVLYIPRDEGLKKEFGEMICLSGRNNIIRSRDGADVLCTLGNRTHLIHWHNGMELDSGGPGVILNRFGKGISYYFCSDLGTAFMKSPLKRLKQFIAHPLIKTGQDIEVKAPSRIQVTAFLKDRNRLYMHLVNNLIPLMPDGINSDTTRTYHVVEEIEPARDIKIKLNGMKATSAYMPISGILPNLSAGMEVTVPEVKYHEVIIFEFE